MSRFSKFFPKALSVRLSMMIVLAVAVLLTASLIIMSVYSRKELKDETLHTASTTLKGTIQRIDNVLLSVEQATGNMYFAILPNIDQKDLIVTFCRKLVETNPNVSGCAIAFKPGFYQESEQFMAYVCRVNDGGEEHLEEKYGAESFAGIPYTEQAWYKESMATHQPCWLPPLKGSNADIDPLITFCLPLPGADGEPIGVIGVDVSLSLLSDIVLAVKPTPNSYCTLLAADGSYLVHPNIDKLLHQTVFTQLSQNADPSVAEAAEAMVSGGRGFKPFKMDGADYIVFFEPFSRTAVPGRYIDDLGWSAGLVYPEDDIFGDYNFLLYFIIGIAIVGILLLWILVRTIIHRQLMPLQMLAQSAQHIAEGNYNETVPDSHQHDEIGSLQNHFQLMQQSLSTHISELEQMTATLRERGEGLRLAYEHAQKADRLKTAFLHNMSNQMISPAAAIDADVEALCDFSRAKDKLEADRLTSDILQHGKTITEVLNNLLAMSEEEMGKEASHD